MDASRAFSTSPHFPRHLRQTQATELEMTVDQNHSSRSVVADAPLRAGLSQTLHAVDKPAAAGLALIESSVGPFVGEPPLQPGILLGAAGGTGSCTYGTT